MGSVRSGTWMACALAAALALLGTGCSKDAPPPAPIETPALETAQVQGFGLARWGAERHNGRPALVLEFSQPLAVTQPFDELLKVTGPDGAEGQSGWTLDPDRTRLRYPYIEADKSYTVRIDARLTAAEGASLGSEVVKEIHSGALPPQVGFASQGSVLPARNTDGLPVVSVNVAEVDVEFLRVRPSEYSNFFANFQRSGQRQWWDMGNLSGLADSVYANRFVLNQRPNERTVSFLPVQTVPELREPGLYFAVLRQVGDFSGQYQTTFFSVTDIGLHARLHAGQLWVRAASLDSGQPRSGVRVEVIDGSGRVVAEAATDGDGQATLAHAPKPEDVLVARRDAELALIPFRQPALDLADFEVAGRRHTALDAYVWSGRDLFRPGETVQASALLRDFDGRSLSAAQPLFARLLQPDGRAVVERELAAAKLGYYSFEQKVAEDAPTGRWRLELRTAPDDKTPVGSFSFRVEEFLPERMKLNLDAEAGPLTRGADLAIDIEGAYLYGAPASGNRFSAELAYRVDSEAVPALRGYRFGDATLQLPAPHQVLDVTLGEDGRSAQTIELLKDGAASASPLQVIVNGSLFESGGRAIRRSLVRSLWPAPQLVGVRPLFELADGPGTETEAGFEIVRSDAQGQLQAGQGLQVKLVQALRDLHWSWVDGSGWKTDYSERFLTVESRTIDVDGRTPTTIRMPVQWGEYRLEVTDPATGLTTRLPFTAGWGWDDENRGLDARPDKVKLALDKPAYRVGDIAGITVTAPYEGPAVLLVESDRLLHSESVEVRPGTTLRVPVSEAMNRHDVYATLLLMRPGQNASQPGPNRALGIVHLPMARDERRISLTVDAPDAPVRPGQPLEITVQASDLAGETAQVTIDAVDQGILSLTRYPLPDPIAHFLARRGLSIEAWDLYGRVIERFEGQRARLRFGGDAALPNLPQARRPTAKVKTIALHSGPVAFDAQGRATVRFEAPDFNGALRVAALAFSAERYGQAEDEVIVRAPLVMEVSTPRVMAPGDRAQLSVDLQNLSGADARYTVNAKADAPLRIAGGSQQVELRDGARRTLVFDLEAGAGNTAAKFSVSANDGSRELVREFELVVRPAWPAERVSRMRVLNDGETLSYDSGDLAPLEVDSALLQVSLSRRPPIPFTDALKGLIDYPYGCLEQTSSRLWPLVWLASEGGQRLPVTTMNAHMRRDAIAAGFARLSAMQQASGHFSFWPGDSWEQPMLTPYVADLLLSAREQGEAIPEAVLEAALKRLSEDLLSGGDGYWNYENPAHLRFAARAHAGYVLARVNRAPLGTLRTLFDNEQGQSLTALPLVHLAVALQLQGDPERARKALAAAETKTDARPEYLGDYGSEVRDAALIQVLLRSHGMSDASTDEALLKLVRAIDARGPQRWFSTQEQAALFRLGSLLLQDGDERLGLRVSGEDPRPPALLHSLQLDADALRGGVRIEPEGAAPIHVVEDLVGFRRQAPAPVSEGLRLQRHYFHTDGREWDGSTLKEGDTLVVRLTLESETALREGLVVDLLPGGLEAENLGLGDPNQIGSMVIDGLAMSERQWQADIKHQEYRDDRFVAAVSLWPGQQARLFYLVRAVSPGDYVLPPPFAEDMYRPDRRAIGEAKPARVRVGGVE
ncbi:alpha-2-macroglobulin [uncultured Aquimonas sp.]|uniref:alpha-2-macroglobulin family protein n=1 Tax=uncultured Aquimonas sp. TaxID=385483 RepID=UPI00086B3358|nr:alpha-2-macroglobulin [uncultured Aquimonas sp.]ODU48027.1 MAG: hypothetical protein ABS96_01450 [Xanthomonadaceae bacterium SCN 69-123]